MKPKLYNVLFPIWILIFLPPFLFLFILENGILSLLFLFLFFHFFYNKEKQYFFKKSWIRLMIFSFICHFILALLLLIPQLLGEHNFIYEHFAYPLSTNPWQDSYAICYLLSSFFLSLLFFILMNYYFIFKNLDLKNCQKKIFSCLFSIILAPYLFFLPSEHFYPYQTNELESYSGISLKDSNLSDVINQLDFKNQIPNYQIINQQLILNFNKEKEPLERMQREELASYLFHLTQDLEQITFQWEETFSYTFDEINQLYNQNLREINLNVIQMRYHTHPFLRYQYLGHIDRYDVFLNTDRCEGEMQTFSLAGQEYQIEGFCPEQLEVYEHNKKYQLEMLLEEENFSLEEIKKMIDSR